MTPFALPRAMQEFVCCFQALRKLGFSADNVSFVMYDGGVVQALLTTQDKTLRLDCGTLPPEFHDQKRAQNLYVDVCSELPKWSDTELDGIWRRSFICKNKVELLSVLLRKGITIPRREKKL